MGAKGVIVVDSPIQAAAEPEKNGEGCEYGSVPLFKMAAWDWISLSGKKEWERRDISPGYSGLESSHLSSTK